MARPIVMYVGEDKLLDMDMTGAMRTGSDITDDTISSVVSVVADVAGVTISGQTHDSAQLVQFRVAAATAGSYTITVTVLTSGGDTVVNPGSLLVKST